MTGEREQLVEFARDIRELYRRERERSRDLERTVDELHDAYFSTMETLAALVEAKDVGTRRHLDRTRDVAMALARVIAPELADRPETQHGFLLHDIGKVAIPEAILTKPGALTPSEWAVMRSHPLIGAQIVTPIKMLGASIEVVRFHHERYDGSGYPYGLGGDRIPLAARIFAVADAFDAMTNNRPYRPARSPAAAVEEIVRCSGSQFDPEVVEAFVLVMGADLTVRVTGDEHVHMHELAPAAIA